MTAGKGKHLSRVKVVQRCAKVAFIARLTSPLTFGKSVFSSRVLRGLFLEGRGLSTEGNLRFKIDWASLIFGSKFTVFALFYFVFEGNFISTSPRGLIFGGGIQRRVFLCYQFGGLIFGGAYFRNFTVLIDEDSFLS